MKPDVTYIAARILGPLMIAVGVAFITQSGAMLSAAGDFMGTNAMRVLAGMIGMGAGLTIVVLHPRWDNITAILVTLTGWVLLVDGMLHLLAPNLLREGFLFVTGNPQFIPVTGCVVALAGVWLSYSGYIAGTLRVDVADEPRSRRY